MEPKAISWLNCWLRFSPIRKIKAVAVGGNKSYRFFYISGLTFLLYGNQRPYLCNCWLHFSPVRELKAVVVGGNKSYRFFYISGLTFLLYGI